MPNTPVNIIYTGVSGTGKTYQLLQIAQQYTDQLPAADSDELVAQLLYDLSWRDVLCLILLDFSAKQKELVKVPEIVAHEFFIAKAAHNERDKNLSNTVWSVLQMHSPLTSATVVYKNRAAQAYFDKDESGAWFLLPESLPLLSELSERLAEFRQAQRDNVAVKQSRFSMVSFHQAYGYEEFVEGIRPIIGENTELQSKTSLSYGIQDGAFLQLCARAANDPEQRYAMLIDEINRANVSRVFGELLSLIEPDKRSGMTHAMQVNLAYSGRPFTVPSNVDIYATMNTQDHSLAPLDMALRRRFRFIECPPRPELLPTIDTSDESNIDLAQLLSGLNHRISHVLGQEAQLGHAFLWSVNTIEQLQMALIEQIIPQLGQATGGQTHLLQYVFNDDGQPLSDQFIQDGQATLSSQFEAFNTASFQNQQALLFSGQPSFLGHDMSHYRLNPDLLANTGAFTSAATYQRLY